MISYDLGVITDFFPEVAILKIGTNDLTIQSLEVVGSNIDNLVRLLRRSFAVKVVGICEIIPRGGTLILAPRNSKGKLISRMPSGLSHTPPRLQSICWKSLFYYDRAMPMGCAKLHIPYILHLLDDYFNYVNEIAGSVRLNRFKLIES